MKKETFFGQIISSPRKLNSSRKSDEAWGKILVTRGRYANQVLTFTCPFELLWFMRVTSTLVVARGEIGVRKGRTVLFICDLKDAGVQAGYEDLAAVAELYGLAFTKEEYDRCLEVLGIKNPYDAKQKLADDVLFEGFAHEVGNELAEKFKELVERVAGGGDVNRLAELFDAARTGLDASKAVHAYRALRRRVAASGTTVFELVKEKPWVLAQVFNFKEGLMAADAIASHLGIKDRVLQAAGYIMAFLMEQCRQGHCFVWMSGVEGFPSLWVRMLKHGFTYEEIRKAVDILKDRQFASRFGGVCLDSKEMDVLLKEDFGVDINSFAGKSGKEGNGREKKPCAVYLRGVFFCELHSAQRTARAVVTPGVDVDGDLLEREMARFAAMEGVSLDPEQLALARAVAENKITVLTGYAGSGKTAALKALVNAWAYLRGEVPDVLAPTALAAYRAAEGTVSEEYAATVHRYSRFFADESDLAVEVPHGNFSDAFGTSGLVVVDESSMMTPVLLDKLMYACERGCGLRNRFVFAGDPGQLGPVGPGGIFPGLIRLGDEGYSGIAHVHLRENHRNDDIVVVNALRIRSGQKIEPEHTKPGVFDVLYADSEDGIISLVVHRVRELVSGGIPLEHVMVLAPTRSKSAGTNKLNAALQAAFGSGEEIPDCGFCVGDPVVAVRNDYKRSSNGIPGWLRGIRVKERPDIYNGMTGVVRRVVTNGETFVEVVFTRGRKSVKAYYRPREMDFYLEKAYSMTVHKAQGGQALHVVLALGTSLNRRDLIYTAITRCMAGGSVTIVTLPEFEKAPYAHAALTEAASGEDSAVSGEFEEVPPVRVLSKFRLRVKSELVNISADAARRELFSSGYESDEF
ncbi:hypothetical protein Desku_0756 [Desulfofundulus kuznetsovii DSM 6115]|uniref:UvrD-like helicase C-terminal domain-containing protein n=1 Tax=Desulfofundulus kuznetsovii (strain DSM 6115 / VKM B-1805 / 17) TaxID=760568 RepID=A0AAU8PF53_DESK7|nr:hypothetical protein Desku_0756 [Desulfofundulus kuznetsovii DSM 6115]